MSQLKKTLLLLLLFSLGYLFFSSPAIAATETIFSVIEGEIFCFEIPEDFRGIQESERLQTGVFSERIDSHTGWVIVDQENKHCFIPEKYTSLIASQLQPGSMVLVYFHYREDTETEWDILAVATKVEEGQFFSEGTVETTETKPTIYIPEASTLTEKESEESGQETGADSDQSDIDHEETVIEDGEGEETPTPTPTPPSPPPEPEPPAPEPTPSGPTASFTSSTTSGAVPLSVNFDASGSSGRSNDGRAGTIASYNWDFGDGNSATGVTASNTYTTVGTYTATLTVTDTAGDTGSSSTTITAGDDTSFYWVDPVNGSDSNNGSNTTPFRSISYALLNMDPAVSTTINLFPGTYSISGGESFPLSMISLPGTFRIDGVGDDASAIIIDGTGNDTGANPLVAFDTITVTVADLTLTNNSVMSAIAVTGATVTLDNCVISNNTAPTDPGGGMWISSSSTVTLTDCTVNGNQTGAGIMSGGIHTESNSSLGLINCTIANNQAGDDGGGLYVEDSSLSLCGCTIFDNTSGDNGGGLAWLGNIFSELQVSDSTFNGNSAINNGGGLFIGDTSMNTQSNLQRLNIYENTCSAAGQGAGVYVGFDSTAGTLVIENCRIVRNTGVPNTAGGGIHLNSGVAVLTQYCTLAANDGAGILFQNPGTPMVDAHYIANSIVYGNTNYGISEDSIGNTPIVDTCAIYANTVGIALYLTVAYPDTQAGMNAFNAVQPNNIWVDPATAGYPGFKDAATDNYRLNNVAATANIIDGADPGVTTTTDLLGNPRPFGSGYDLGCYEYQGVDPPITGTVYDAATGTAVSGPVTAIFNSKTNAQVGLSESNPFTFNVDPGSYYLAVSKDGYAFPSQMVESTVAGDHGDIFSVSGAMTINIPLDPDGWLVVTKTCNKERVEIGDIVTYRIKVENKHWYKSVDNVELTDELVNGFKFVEGSGINGQPTSTSNHKVIYSLGTVAANSSTYRSYQVRVGSAMPPGKYKAAAHTRKSTTLARNSNIDSVDIEVKENPLFSRGTIIGKVFWDENENTVQDNNEAGIPHITIYTEYGVVVETDEDGKYHIADVPPGNHLLKIDTRKQAAAIAFTTDNPLYVKVTEGLLAKANFGVTLTEALEEDRDKDQVQAELGVKDILSKFFIVALGEGEIRNLNTSGNIAMVDKDDRYDDGVKVDGRLALYLKGKVLGKYLITASIDSERRKGGHYHNKDLFTNLDPDKYYPVYGDASTVDYSGVDTQDVAYVLIEWDNSFAKWGNFNTLFNLYNRTLSGGLVNYVSVKKTKFGDPYTIVKGFGAFSRQKPAHDEFVGTGGSLYYLRHRDVIEGSEKIRVEVRDRISKTTLNTLYLKEEIDYEIDYDSGRILLKKPLNSVQQTYGSSIISNDILMGERAYLVVDYEYYGGGMSEQSWGGRVSQQLGPYFRVGSTYVEEQKPGDNYTLAGGDATVKLNTETQVTAKYTRTANTQLDSGMSYDGGLSFSQQGAGYSNGKSGSALSVDGQTRLFNNTDIYLSYSRQDPFYSVSNSIASQGTQKYIGRAVSRITENLSAGLSHITQRYHQHTIVGTTMGARDIHTSSAILDYQRGRWDLRGEYQHQRVTKPFPATTYFGTIPLVNNDFLAARVGYQLFKWFHPYLRGQYTINGRRDNQGTAGADIRIGKTTIINVAKTVGSLGNSTLLGVTSTIAEDTDAYANLEVGNNLRLGKYTKTTYGQSTILGLNEKIYVEQDYSSYQENIVRGNILGYKKNISDTLALGVTYERSHVKRISNAIDRDAGSIALAYLNPHPDFTEGIKAYTKLECRNDQGTSQVRQWVTENDALWRLTESLTISGRGNWGWTENRTRKQNEAEFYELGTGFSFRPVSWDRLNVLGKYSYLTDLPPDVQWDFAEETKTRKHVYSIEGVFDLCRYIQLVGKYAHRQMKDKVGARRNWTKSTTYLYLGRTNFQITNANKNKPFFLRGWDLGVEYRVLANKQIEDSKDGFLVDLTKSVGDHLLLGLGYNFTDYDDDLRGNDTWDSKGWFMRVSGKY